MDTPERNHLQDLRDMVERASVHASSPYLSNSLAYATDVLRLAIIREEDRIRDLLDKAQDPPESADRGNPLHAGARHKSFTVIVEGKVQP